MTLAVHWEPSEAASTPAIKSSCVSRKLGFDTPEEARWWMNRRNWPKAAVHLYRCRLGCGQIHATSQPPVERKRFVKSTRRRRLGLT
jgi:hypothetical protein